MLIWMANNMVVHNAPDDVWSQISYMPGEATISIVLLYVSTLATIKVMKYAAA